MILVGVAAQVVGASGEATSHQHCVYRRHVVVEASEHREGSQEFEAGEAEADRVLPCATGCASFDDVVVSPSDG